MGPSPSPPASRSAPPRVRRSSALAPSRPSPATPSPTSWTPGTSPRPVAPDAGGPDAIDAEADSDAADPEAELSADAPDTEPDAPDTEPAAEPDAAELLHVATERSGPPYYVAADLAELRERHGLDPASPPARPPVRWRCLIADPSCRYAFELQATGAYALRARQGDVSRGTTDRWHSARAQYDLWVSLPALVETEGKNRYTRMSLGPKGGVVFSDTGDLWGNLGIAARYWLGRGRWAPSIEITSALAFKLGTRVPREDAAPEEFRMQRGPVGFQADVGLGLGGFGAIVLGGQYDSPLAREDVPEQYRVVASGMFYVGFRGNILWGGPAAAAVAAHASTRAVQRP
ncbi:MAG: hypothetical protein KDK70_11925 [Myxococcales bacterium]|nr:hypothetical protein [Myxococcales bacterium]